MQEAGGDSVHVERELKIPVCDLVPVQEALAAAHADRVDGAELECNTLFDTADGRLARQGTALRLRHYSGRWLLTFKGPTSYRGQIKERDELEVEVNDGTTFVAVLGKLGLAPAIRYEKVREMWRLGAVVVSLDHTPLGEFVELEGPASELEAAARVLALEPADAVRGSYLGLWASHRRQHPERDLPRDMLFPR